MSLNSVRCNSRTLIHAPCIRPLTDDLDENRFVDAALVTARRAHVKTSVIVAHFLKQQHAIDVKHALAQTALPSSVPRRDWRVLTLSVAVNPRL